MTKPTEPFTVQQVVSLDAELGNEDDDHSFAGKDIVPDPDSEWKPGALPDEPTWPTPPRDAAEAYARAYARERFWRAYMRAPFATKRQGRTRRPLSERDLIRRTDPPLICDRCGTRWARPRRGRGPIPRLCPGCREVSRNAH